MNVDYLDYIQSTVPAFSEEELSKVVVLVQKIESERKNNRKAEVLGAIQQLRGSLKDEGKTTEEYRAERLSKYEDIS